MKHTLLNSIQQSGGTSYVEPTRHTVLNSIQQSAGTTYAETQKHTVLNSIQLSAGTLRKLVTKYKNMRKWKVEFFRNSEGRGDKIARANSIRITKSINLL